MSDYLTRLLERSLGIAPRIEPLIAPLHSPSEQVLIEPIAPFDAGGSAKSEASLRDITPDDGEASFLQTESAPPSASRELPEAPAEFATGKGGEPAQPSRPRPNVPLRQAFSPPTLEAVNWASSPGASSIISQGNRAVLPPEITERRGPDARPREPIQLPPGKSRPVVQPEIIGPRKAAALSSAPREQLSANQPPAIHVTIGRVEVRAVMAPSAPLKAAAAPTPRISLEEYLKRRNRTSV
ncbi:MAG: hypothetical protein QOF24_2920 [Verrucomicrobiota bacterium]|jgi:hypothetical protein